MKRVTFALSALLLTALAANAQTPPAGGGFQGGPPHGGPSIEQLAKDLNLDETQKTEVKRILEEQHAKRDAERQKLMASGTRPTREQMQASMQANDAALLEQLKGVLRSDQLAKWQQMQEERRQHMRSMGPPPDGAASVPAQ